MGQFSTMDPRVVGKERREGYQNNWQSPLLSTCLDKPGFCLFAMLCAPCASYSVRKQLLYHDMSRYVCCGGACPCSGRMGEKDCPEVCLGLETCICFAQSVASSRFMIQDELLVQTTKCDNCIIGTMITLQYAACIFDIVAACTQNSDVKQLSDVLNCLADLTYCTVCACMQTQHKMQLDVRDGVEPPKEGVLLVAPPVMAMIRPGAPPPPTAVYVGGVPTAPVVQAAPMNMAPQQQYVVNPQAQQVQYASYR